jgi:hypothetical protein
VGTHGSTPRPAFLLCELDQGTRRSVARHIARFILVRLYTGVDAYRGAGTDLRSGARLIAADRESATKLKLSKSGPLAGRSITYAGRGPNSSGSFYDQPDEQAAIAKAIEQYDVPEALRGRADRATAGLDQASATRLIE